LTAFIPHLSLRSEEGDFPPSFKHFSEISQKETGQEIKKRIPDIEKKFPFLNGD
jgi:hypothetical protein